MPPKAYKLTDRQVSALLSRVENSTAKFRSNLDAGRGPTRLVDGPGDGNIDLFVPDLDAAIDALRMRFDQRQSAASDVEHVLRQAAAINDFMLRRPASSPGQDDWALARTALDALARGYNISWRWG